MQAIERIIKIFDSFSLDKPELTLKELTDKTGLHKSTVYRIAEALNRVNILSKDNKISKYRIGIKLFELGSLYLETLELRELAFPEIEKLSKYTEESIHMGVLDGNEVTSIEGMGSSHNLQAKLWIGKRSPIYCTSVGKAILAFLPDKEQEEILSSIELKRYTKNTITDKKEFEKELERIKKQGFALDNEEHDEGIMCVGAPIFNNKGKVVASISISGPKIRMKGQKLEKYKKLLMDSVKRISNNLGK
ncbi:MAG: IclR family transcriptional regulator [Thermotogota bacterium]|nr:IclR family transcriptional regulator [Thermotogota bacterium]